MQHPETIGPRRQTSRLAMLGFLLGLLAVPTTLISGIPAMLVSYQALYGINASEGKPTGELRGRKLAILGMLLGAFGTFVGVAFFGFLIFQRLNEASQRVQCTLNQGQIGQALEIHAELHQGRYPAAVVAGRLPPEKRLSWLTSIAPNLKRQGMTVSKWNQVMSEWEPNQAWDAACHQLQRTTNIPSFLCPSFPRGQNWKTPGLSNFVGLSGVGPNAAELPLDSPEAGMFGFQRQVERQAMVGYQATTLVLTETTLDNGPWIAGGVATLRSVDAHLPRLIGSQLPFGGCHFSLTGQASANTLWLDGSVRYHTSDWPTYLIAHHTRIHH